MIATQWLELPPRLDQARLPLPDATADILQVAQLANLLTSLFWGTNDFYESPQNRLAAARWRADVRTDYVVARRVHDVDEPGRIVGFGFLTQESGTDSAEVWVGVHPGFRRAGIGSALLAEVEAEARRRGRTTLQSWTDNARLEPGETPAVHSEAPDAAFAAARGYELAHLQWCSVLDLRQADGPAPQMESGLQDPDYELVGWEGACPQEYAESMADLLERMRAEERAREQIGLSLVTTAVLHRPSGRLVGHSDIESFRELPQAAYQRNTLIHPDHRGRRLALALKAANVSRLLRVAPTTERLYTWSDQENTAIQRANEELGFVPVSTHPCWQKTD
jgi:GNAT superfamily N-acetyltransferase